MSANKEIKSMGSNLVILSGERTLLSWIRVALSFMSLGFILDRFGLFLRMQSVNSGSAWLPKTYTFLMGAGLVIVGAIVSAAAGIVYTRLRLSHAREGYNVPIGGTILGVVLTLVTTLIGVITAIFLISITDLEGGFIL